MTPTAADVLTRALWQYDTAAEVLAALAAEGWALLDAETLADALRSTGRARNKGQAMTHATAILAALRGQP